MRIESLSGRQRDLKNRPIAIGLNSRIARALKGAGIGLGLAFVFLPFPGIHLVLVPSFLVVAVYMGYKRFLDAYYLNLHRESCPSCLQALNEKEVFYRELPVRLYCYDCRTQLRVVE